MRLPISVFSYIIALLLFFAVASPKPIYAANLNWIHGQGIDSYSQDVRISNSGAIFATLRTSTESGMFKSLDNGVVFTNKFEMMSGRDVNAIAISNRNDNKVWISTYTQGVYKSTDGGNSWSSSGLSSLHVRYLTIDPNNDLVLYAGTGDNNSNGGIYKTIDGGVTWNKVGESTYGSKNCLNIFVDKNDSNRIFAGSDFNLYVSNDAGDSWTALSLGNTFPPATIIDNSIPTTIYSSVPSQGVYKSSDNGANWALKNSSMGTSLVFRLVQDSAGNIFATRVSSGGGVWMSTDGAETWENVADPAWGSANTWGIDAKNGHVAVSVEGFGLFVATISATPTPTPTPVAGPNPVVVIPGFGGSYSTQGLILHQPTSYHDWVMMPFKAPEIYNPFLNALSSIFYLQNDKVFFFGYDFTKPVATSAQWLNDYLGEKVIPNNPGHKADIVAHSMGGLVARYCVEKVTGCDDKIGKIVTAGTPHKGAVDDYFLWEGADFSSLDPLAKFGAKLVLHSFDLTKFSEVQLVQANISGAKDFMPTFDYITGKPYSTLSVVSKNDTIDALGPISSGFSNRTLALSGNTDSSTLSEISVTKPNWWEISFGYWADGKPTKKIKAKGDGTVLASSSQISGAINKSYSLEHTDYLRNTDSVRDILLYLGLSPIGPVSFAEPSSVSVYYSTDPNLEIQTVKALGEETVSPDPNVIFVKGDKGGKRNLNMKATKDGDFEIKGWNYQDSGETKQLKPLKVKLIKGLAKSVQASF